MKRKFTPAIDLLIPSATIIRQNVLTYFVVLITPSLVLTLATRSVTKVEDLISPLLILGLLLTLFFNAPLVYTQTKSAKGEIVGIPEAFKRGYHYFWRLILLNIVFSTLVFVGFLLFIIPGFIVLRRYFVSFYYLIDKDCTVREAMQLSEKATKGNSGAVYGIIGILFLFYMFGVFGAIGAVISSLLQLLYSVAPALRYQEFANKSFKAAGK